MEVSQRLIVGLGNPGKKYEMTRHNLGFLVIQSFARKHGFLFKLSTRFEGAIAKGTFEGANLLLLMPTTFMNCSGRSVKRVADYYKVNRQDLIIVTDDVDIDYGRMRIRAQGSAGGHKGLKDIERHLGSSNYNRLKIGVGDRVFGALEDYVLSKFSKEEQKELPQILDDAVLALECWLRNDMETSIELINSNKM